MKTSACLSLVLLALCAAAPAAARQSDLAPDGTVYVTGPFAHLALAIPFSHPRIEGLLHTTLDGARINDFGRGGFLGGEWQHAVALPDGGVAAVAVHAGSVTVARFDAHGQPTGGGTVSLPLEIVNDVRTLSDGRLLVSGLARAGSAWRLVLAVLRADGTLDPGFGQGGIATSRGTIANPSSGAQEDLPHAGTLRTYGGAPAWVLADGRILAGGPELVARFTASGAPDPTWGADGEVSAGDHQGIVAPAGDGAFVIEVLDTTHVRVHRLGASGLPDLSFGAGGTVTQAVAATGAVKDARVLSDGRLAFLLWPGDRSRPYLLSADGATLTPGPPPASFGPDDLFVAGDGLVVIGQQTERFALSRFSLGLDASSVAGLEVVSTAPSMRIVSGPRRRRGSVTGADAHFRFAVEQRPEDLGFGTVACGDGYPAPCGLAPTLHQTHEGPTLLVVRAMGIHGALGAPTTYRWTVDFAAPNTVVRSRPPAVTRHSVARIAFTTSERATTTCALDGARARRCRSPLHLRHLRRGRHRVRVRATDTLGARETVPASVTWRVSSSRRR